MRVLRIWYADPFLFDQKGFREIFERRVHMGGWFQKVYVLIPPFPGSKVYKNISFGAEVFYHAPLKGNPGRLTSSFFYIFPYLVHYGLKMIKEFKLECIWASDPTLVLLLGYLLSKLSNLPLVISYHTHPYRAYITGDRDYIFRNKYIDFYIQKFIIRRCKAFLYFSEVHKDFAKSLGCVQCVRIYNTPNLERFFPVSPDPNGSFVFIGSLNENKDPLTLVKAGIEYYKKGGTREIWIIGDGKLISKCKEITRDETRIKYFGYIPNYKLPEIMNKAFALILPSLNEGFSNVIMEAQAAGLPVILTDLECIKNGLIYKNVIFFKPKEFNQLSERMIMLEKNKKLWETISREEKIHLEKWYKNNPEHRNFEAMKKIFKVNK